VSRRGPKLRDTIGLAEEIARILADDPTIRANAVVVLTGARRQDVLRIVRLLRPGSVFLSGRERRIS
jgi:hypothetical protein